MNEAKRILMERDGLTEAEAQNQIDATMEEILMSDPFKADDIFMNDLGLEPDYLIDLLCW